MPAACFLQDPMQFEAMELGTFENIKQESPENAHLGRLVCFFCDKEFPGVQVLHSHQQECALASQSQKILTAAKNSFGKKRSFLSYLSLIPKVSAENVRSEKRTDVVVDVIVIDDDSDEENNDITIDKSQRYLLSPNSFESKTKQNGKLRSKNRNCGLALGNAFSKPSSKVFKFDISSPLGMRLRYHCKQVAGCRLNTSKFCGANYELYCGQTTTRIPYPNKCYAVSYRKRQPSKFFHQYKFTRDQLRESCRVRSSGLNLTSLRLRQQMKPCIVSVDKLSLLSDDSSDGTFDAKKYMQMLNLKANVESVFRAPDEDVAVTKMPSVHASDPTSSAVLPNGFVNIFEGLQQSESHQLENIKIRKSFEHPIRRIGAHNTNTLHKPDAHRAMVDVFSPVVGLHPEVVEWVNNRVKNPHAFAKNVEFIPLSALYDETTFEVENHDPQNQMFQISSVYSLAKFQHKAKNLNSDFLEEHHSSESIASLSENVPLQSISALTKSIPAQKIPDSSEPSSSSSADIITIVEHDNSSQDAGEQPSQVNKRQSTHNGFPASANDIIDLTENVSLSLSGCSKSSATISQQAAVESNSHDTLGVLRDIIRVKQLCNPLSDKSEKSSDVQKLPTERQISPLQTQLERSDVIEIPDEESAVFTNMPRSQVTTLSHSSKSNDINANVSATTDNNLLNSNRADTVPLQRLAEKNRHSVLPGWHSVQPIIPARDRNAVQTTDTIDLSFDSDSEPLDQEPATAAAALKRPLPSNFDSCPPSKRDRPGVSLEESSLPPLTFKCHICGSFFNFDNNSGTMIQKHYLLHNVTNIELVKQLLPNGQTTWSLVELNKAGQSAHPRPSGPAAFTSVPHASILSNHVGKVVSATHPPYGAPRYTQPVASSSRSALYQGDGLPEFVNLEQSCIPATLYSHGDESSATKRSSPSTARLNSENNRNMIIPPRHTSSVTELSTAKAVSCTNSDTVLSGRQEQNHRQTDNEKTMRAVPFPGMRPNVPNFNRILPGALPRATMAAAFAEQRQQIYFPIGTNLNRMFVNRERGESNVGDQMQSKHSALSSIQSNSNVAHGVICLD